MLRVLEIAYERFKSSFFQGSMPQKPLSRKRQQGDLIVTLDMTVQPCTQGLAPGGGGYSHTLPIWGCPPNGAVILKLLIQNGLFISEAFSRTGYNILNARKLQFCKQPFEITQGQIASENTVQCVNSKLLYSLHHRTEYKKLAHFQNGVSVLGRILERGINFRGNFFQNRVPIWSPRRHIPTQKMPKCLPPTPGLGLPD